MSAHVLVSGTLFRDPESKIGKSGKPFVKATVRIKDGEGSIFWTLMSFSETAMAELTRMRDGDAIAAQGGFRGEIYSGKEGGEPKVRFTLFADQILALRQARKVKTEQATKSHRKPAPSGQQTAAKSHQRPVVPAEFDDEIPWRA